MSAYNPGKFDLVEKAEGRIIYQYRNGPKFRQWVSIIPDIAARDISAAAEAVAGLINLDTAEDEALNICGRIAQIERPVIPEPDLDNVTYLTALGDEPPQLGDVDAQLVSLDSAVPIDLQDDVYRRLIRAKIAVNTSDATIDSIASTLAQAAGLAQNEVRVNDYQNMTFDVVFLGELDPIIRFTISNYPVTPKPQGVKLLGYVEEPYYVQLGADWQLGDDEAQLMPVYL